MVESNTILTVRSSNIYFFFTINGLFLIDECTQCGSIFSTTVCLHMRYVTVFHVGKGNNLPDLVFATEMPPNLLNCSNCFNLHHRNIGPSKRHGKIMALHQSEMFLPHQCQTLCNKRHTLNSLCRSMESRSLPFVIRSTSLIFIRH